MSKIPIDPMERIRLASKKSTPIFEPTSMDGDLAQLESHRHQQEAELQRQMEAITRARETGKEGADTRWGESAMTAQGGEPNQSVGEYDPNAQQSSVMGGKVGINQAFGNYNPGIERYSKDGRNYGVDFGVKEGTPLALPPGEWKVVQAFAGAKGRGRIGDSTNSGYGNSVLVLNTQTGEMMRFSHLQSVNLREGSVYKGGTIFGRSGATGNVTGPHLDLEYKDSGGQLRDIMSSQYAKYLFEN